MRKKRKALYDFDTAPVAIRRRCVANKLKHRNNQVFVGFVTEILPPRLLTINNKNHVIRVFVMEEKGITGHVRSSIALQVPDTFELARIEILKDKKIPATCEYFTKIVRKGNACFTACQCSHIYPADLTNMTLLEQKLNSKNRSRTHNIVDDDGFRFPYDY